MTITYRLLNEPFFNDPSTWHYVDAEELLQSTTDLLKGNQKFSQEVLNKSWAVYDSILHNPQTTILSRTIAQLDRNMRQLSPPPEEFPDVKLSVKNGTVILPYYLNIQIGRDNNTPDKAPIFYEEVQRLPKAEVEKFVQQLSFERSLESIKEACNCLVLGRQLGLKMLNLEQKIIRDIEGLKPNEAHDMAIVKELVKVVAPLQEMLPIRNALGNYLASSILTHKYTRFYTGELHQTLAKLDITALKLFENKFEHHTPQRRSIYHYCLHVKKLTATNIPISNEIQLITGLDLQSLKLKDCMCLGSEEFKYITKLTNLTTLILQSRHNALNNADFISLFTHLRKLKKIGLNYHENISDKSWKLLTTWPESLERLSILDAKKMRSKTLYQILKNNPHLIQLEMGHYGRSVSTSSKLKLMDKLSINSLQDIYRNLHELTYYKYSMDDFFKELPKTTLKELYKKHGGIEKENLDKWLMIHTLEKLPDETLKDIYLQFQEPIKEDCIDTLSKEEILAHIKRLKPRQISNIVSKNKELEEMENNLEKKRLNRFKDAVGLLKEMVNLEKLTLHSWGRLLTPETVKAVAQWGKLHTLDLSLNVFLEAHQPILKEIAAISSLVKFKMHMTVFFGPFLEQLSANRNLKSVEAMSSGNLDGAPLLKELTVFKHLETLIVEKKDSDSKKEETAQLRKKLAKALPQTKIIEKESY